MSNEASEELKSCVLWHKFQHATNPRRYALAIWHYSKDLMPTRYRFEALQGVPLEKDFLPIARRIVDNYKKRTGETEKNSMKDINPEAVREEDIACFDQKAYDLLQKTTNDLEQRCKAAQLALSWLALGK